MWILQSDPDTLVEWHLCVERVWEVVDWSTIRAISVVHPGVWYVRWSTRVMPMAVYVKSSWRWPGQNSKTYSFHFILSSKDLFCSQSMSEKRRYFAWDSVSNPYFYRGPLLHFGRHRCRIRMAGFLWWGGFDEWHLARFASASVRRGFIPAERADLRPLRRQRWRASTSETICQIRYQNHMVHPRPFPGDFSKGMCHG